MMTSAGSAKAAKVTVLGVGVAGLQAIATSRKLGAAVEAYDVRPETKEQILSLGAKPIEIQLDEQGSGTGGYAKELSEAGKKKLQAGLDDKLKKSDIIITTANVPGRKAPILVTEEVVRGMKRGSVIIDMAAPSGGNCALTKPGQTVDVEGVKIVGVLNYPALVASDSSSFFARNIVSLLTLTVTQKDGKSEYGINLQDDILDGAMVIHGGERRKK
jgi:NAD(P) transhydrogenase subunit alpha